MRRRAVLAGIAAVMTVATACTAGTGTSSPPSIINPSASHAPVTLTLWSFYTGRELKQYNQVLDQFHQQFPWITVNHVGGKSPQDIVRAINSGTAPDATLEPGPDDVAKYCSSGAWVDLNPYLKAAGENASSIIPPSALKFTSYQGNQCALPVLSDAYGLYYNTQMFQKAGLSGPPKTFTEFSADAKKLTTFNPDGSIKVAGFVPLMEFYENPALDQGALNGAQFYDSSGKAAFATDPRWTQLLQWQKSLVDWFGYAKLQKFFASLGGPDSEWTTQQAFESGKVAMTIDGEWRVAFIDGDKSKVPYATAPGPVADDQPSLYGAGQIGGDIIGIPRGSQHPNEAWSLVNWLATDTQAEVSLSQALKNVPTTFDSLKDPTLAAVPHFDTFLKIFANPNSTYKQITPLGLTDAQLWQDFVVKYLAGNIPNLQAGLKQVSSQIDKQSSLG